jgi:hypothetical protein
VLCFSNIRPITTLYVIPVIFIPLKCWSSIWLPGLRKTVRVVGSEVLSQRMTLKPTILSDMMPCTHSTIEVLLFYLVVCVIFLFFDPGSRGSSFPAEYLILFYWTTGNTSQKTVSIFKILCSLSLC